MHWTAALLFALILAGPLTADESKDDGFVPMFNGKDLTGWVNVNCAPGTFFVKDGEIITTGKPTGYLRTEKQYENFIADFEWMHVNKKEVGNSGFFVWADPLPAIGTPYTRGIEVQVLVNLEKAGYYTSQGDLFSIHGATCKPDRPHPQGWMRCLPSENRCKGGGEWNHYIVTANNGTIKLNVNGKVVSGLSECKPRKGYLALESEGAECHFRNLRIKELPSSNPKPEEISEQATAFKNLFTGLDLSGWKANDETKKHWQPRDWVLHYDGKGGMLATDREFADAEFIVDFRFPKKDAKSCVLRFRGGQQKELKLTFTPDGTISMDISARDRGKGAGSNERPLRPIGQWNRMRISIHQQTHQLTLNGQDLALGRGRSDILPQKFTLIFQPEGEMDFGNLFVRELKK
jgi:hypothetical protein